MNRNRIVNIGLAIVLAALLFFVGKSFANFSAEPNAEGKSVSGACSANYEIKYAYGYNYIIFYSYDYSDIEVVKLD